MSYPPPLPPPPPWTAPPRTPPTGPAVGWAVALWIIAGLALCGSLLFGGLSAYGFYTDHHMREHGITTTATVVEVDGDDVTVHYTTQTGSSVQTEIFYWSDVPAEDATVDVVYDPDDPSYAISKDSNEDRVIAIVLAVIAGVAVLVALGTAIGAIVVHRTRRRRRLQLKQWFAERGTPGTA